MTWLRRLNKVSGMGSYLLQVTGLRKSYGKFLAVDGVSFDVAPGEVFGLLGPNGAGKTTTVRCICGLLRSDQGRIVIDGVDIAKSIADAKRKMGVAPQELALYDELTVEQNLQSFGRLYGLGRDKNTDRVDFCLDLVKLSDFRTRKVAELSGGMKRRLNLAVSLMHEPHLLLLDEPTVGVDPQSRNHIFSNIETLAKAGLAVVYTTHYMEEVERLCGRAAIVDQGKIVAMDTVEGLLKLVGETRRVKLTFKGTMPGESTTTEVRDRFSPSDLSIQGSELALSFASDIPFAGLTAFFAERNSTISTITMERPTLEDAFLKLTGRQLRDR